MSQPENEPPKAGAAFDFNAAARRAKTDFPEETKNITFLDLSADDAREQLRAWLETTDPAYRTSIFGRKTIEQFIEASIKDEGYAATDPLTGRSLLAGRSDPNPGFFWKASPSVTGGFLFAHELGHLVVDGGNLGDPMDTSFAVEDEEQWRRVQETLHSELAAETFAALYSMKNGWLPGVEEIGKVSNWRATVSALHGGVDHFTSPALDALSGQDAAAILSLSPQEIRAVAAAYAKTFVPGISDIGAAISRFQDIMAPHVSYEPDPEYAPDLKLVTTPKTTSERLYGMAQAFLDSQSPPLVAYAAAAALPPILETGKISLSGEEVELSGAFWNDLRARMTADGARPGLPFLQNKADLTELSGSSPAVARFARQQPKI